MDLGERAGALFFFLAEVDAVGVFRWREYGGLDRGWVFTGRLETQDELRGREDREKVQPPVPPHPPAAYVYPQRASVASQRTLRSIGAGSPPEHFPARNKASGGK